MARHSSKDLFDESTMSFGEHLEVLRVHLWKAILGTVVAVTLTLIWGDRIVAVIRKPIDEALQTRGVVSTNELWNYAVSLFSGQTYDGRSAVTDSGLGVLAGHPKLRRVNLSGTRVTSNGLRLLSNAKKELDVQADAVSIAGLDHLNEFGVKVRLNADQQPVSVAMSGVTVGDEHLEAIGKLESLKVLDLRETGITDDGLKSLNNLTNLERLNLVGTPVSDEGLAALVPLSGLKTLLLSSTSVTDEGLEHVAKLTNLERLNLIGTTITDEGLKHIARLEHLTSLSLGGRGITDKGLETLAGLKHLERLDLAGSRITNEGLKHVGKLVELEELNLVEDPTYLASNRDDAFSEIVDDAGVVVYLRASRLAELLHRSLPAFYPEPPAQLDERRVPLLLSASEFAVFRETSDRVSKPITLNVQEAFMTYLKVAIISGIVLASPWIFWQMWQFVAAGLYPHEQKYIYIYLPFSLSLFLGGILFCFFLVFPFVLQFLLGFNTWLEVTPQIRLSEWISFAVMMPLLFGVSFQLPLVMLFLERISIFDANDYSQKRRMAVLIISILSMMLTPADPASMILMMIPLVFLYELGILLCRWTAKRSPFAEAAA